MDIITIEKLKEVIAKRSDWCVSLFMPTHRAGLETEQDPIRFKNLLKNAEERLLDKGLRLPEVDEMLKDPRRLFQERLFWQHQSDGLALFFSKDNFQFFRVPLKLTEKVIVTGRFHVKPLLPLLTSGGTFHILAISQNQLRLLEGTQHTVDEIELGEMPKTLSDSLPDDWLKEKLQIHIGTPSGGGSSSAKSHGHDTGSDTKVRLRKWFRAVDKALAGILSDTGAPLVLAGVDSLFPLYKEVNTYPHLVDEGIPGNPDEMKSIDLHPMAWAIVEPIFKKKQEAGLEKYRQLAGTGKTTTDVSEALIAANHGRVDALFLALGVQVWGRFDPENDKVELHEKPQPGDEDLLDFTAIQTWITGGSVFIVSQDDVPERALVAAVLRY